MSKKPGDPATLDELSQIHRVSREKVRIMQFKHGILSDSVYPKHDFEDGKHNTTCMVCGYTRGDNGGAEAESDRQQDR